MTKTEKLFDDVVKTLHTRGESYGHPYYNHKRIAELWSAYIGYPIQPNQVAMCMALVKISRSAEDCENLDNYTDALGYIAISRTVHDAMQDELGEWQDGI